MGYVYCWKEKIEDGPRPVSYAKCKVYSDNDKIVRIECSGDQALKIFLNGQEIFKRNTSVIRQIIPGSFKLNKGYNDVLIKVAQNHPKPFSGRELGFNFRFVDEEGEILEDLLYRP